MGDDVGASPKSKAQIQRPQQQGMTLESERRRGLIGGATEEVEGNGGERERKKGKRWLI